MRSVATHEARVISSLAFLLVSAALAYAGYRYLKAGPPVTGTSAVPVVAVASRSPPPGPAGHALPKVQPEQIFQTQAGDDPRHASPGSGPDDVASLVASSIPLKERYDRVRAEGRDKEWAPRSERLIEDQYRHYAGPDVQGAAFKIKCGRTVCEVRVEISNVDDARGRTLTDQIQSSDLSTYLWDHGLRPMGAAFGMGMNVTYYDREAPGKTMAR